MNGAISSSILSKMAADSHLGMAALSRVTLASAGLSCLMLTQESHAVVYYCVVLLVGPNDIM